MEKYIEVTGKTEDAAISAGLAQLGLDRDSVSVEILERAKTGFLGIGSCPAKVKVTYEAPDEPEEAPAPAFPHGASVTSAGKTVGMMQEKMGFDPVVGWLVCTEGPSRGKSYTIRGGINSIGRSDRMDITITGDRTISAENHARLSYSDKNNRFNLLPGDGRNIVYLNGEEVFSPMPLKAYDQIDFGATKLLFIPLCGEQFTWTPEPGEGGHGTV